MPNRIIKESICISESVDALSWFEEVFFYRLIVNCDDYGRMDARPPILRARLFPLKTVTDKQIENALKSLRTADIVYLYEVDGKPFLQLRTWERHQTIRAKRSKYPGPNKESTSELVEYTYESKCMQMHANVPVIQSESKSESKSEVESKSERRARARDTRPVIEDLINRFGEVLAPAVDDWLSYKQERREAYKPTGLKSFLSRVEREAQEHGDQVVADVIQLAMSNGWRGIVWEKLTQKDGRRNEQNAGNDKHKQPQEWASGFHSV